MTRRRLALVAAGVALMAAAAMWSAARAHRLATAALTASLVDTPTSGDNLVTASALEGVPPPVEKYLRRALTAGQPHIRVARFTQVGELRTAFDSERWFRFEASHTVSPPQRGFVWDARVEIAPLLHLRVRDAYVDGEASGRVALLSAIPLGSQAGRPEVNSGSLHRYLAEAVWYPTALLPGGGLRWEPIGTTKALATLTHGGVSVSLEFRFDEQGDVASIYSPGRWGAFADGYRQVPWEGHFRSYHATRGMRVPAEGEVGWYDNGEWRRVWTGHVIDTSYEFATAAGS